MGELKRLDEFVLSDLKTTTLDHDDRVLRAGEHDVHVGELELLEGRVQHPLAVQAPDTNPGDRTRERRFGHVQGRRGAHQPQHVSVVLLVGRENVDDDLHLVHEILWEQGPDRAIDLTCRKDLLLTWPPLPLEEAARDLAGRVALFTVFDCQREKGELRRLVIDDHRRQHGSLAELHEYGPVRLAGHAAGLEDQSPTCKLTFNQRCHSLRLSSLRCDWKHARNDPRGVDAPGVLSH